MAPLRTFASLFLAASSASAFAPSTSVVSTVSRPSTSVASSVFDDAVKDWGEEYPQFAEWGWGPSVQAEIWNGRHAMFGWVVMCSCAYAKGHDLFPNGDAALNLKEWGTLSTIASLGNKGMDTITNERAIILIANVHAFFVGIAATIAPLPMSDTLLLDPNHPMYEWQMERNSKLGGIMPDMKQSGVTPHAELMNGRMAMMGLIALLGYSGIQGQSMIDTINQWIGGAYY
mmetsp:Transcript_20445/g.36754  ORF Transcript_20445/g.36754 Transcript_20445/m.36754 type:complete len:230 (-) Transcript_20445:311-1000(-)|eukprot:CAMPEP_0201598370 /NCGR_PEP_ID=MMETSP0492-20130828/179_1 /ASSEMBLY_ACC=CAM_ASM_000837 /TAXON_ID=420259 /ORGANISM="Thalassiosira gravida, Strain GMp14c1" /LENGTH=229 /DNA_ID=CAMNT_0048060771 /DNA_START=29 /DNA_END=718 /DNA_ORIENTATION=+